MTVTTISRIGELVGEEVELRGWLYNYRSSGRIVFLLIRDGSGTIQAVAAQNDVPDQVWERLEELTQESAVIVRGVARKDDRAPGGYELHMSDLELVSRAESYPITLKEHGVEFLMDHRHLWLRTPTQAAIMRIRDTVVRACEDYLHNQGFVRVDSPILTPAACEGTSTLFETDYFGESAYLSQSGQLYAEAAALALGKVYCYGPTFRAEKSKTRRHLIEFWMIEPEVAYLDHEGNMQLQEQFITHMVQTVLNRHAADLELLERDTSLLEKVVPPFPRITYDEALDIIRKKGLELPWGEDFGTPHELAITEEFDRPVFVEKYPAQAKAFYMERDPERPEVVLAADLLAPEGYVEIIGGSQRIHDYDLLLRRIEEHDLPREAFEWYLDLRRYGTVPQSGYGMGIERAVAWICKLDHLREAMPFPRLLNRIYP